MTEQTSPQSNHETPPFVLQEINSNVEHDIAREESPEVQEFLRQVTLDEKTTTYNFLRHLGDQLDPKKVLYVASGHDPIPKLALGEDKVVHTSLETHTKNNPQKYFDDLPAKGKVIADNAALPFTKGAFDMILIFNTPSKIGAEHRDEYVAALKPGGVIVTATHFLRRPEEDNLDYYGESPALKPVNVPAHFQKQGDAEMEFLVFEKTNTTP